MVSGGIGVWVNLFDGILLIGKIGMYDFWLMMMIELSMKVVIVVWVGCLNGNYDNVFNVWIGSYRFNEVWYLFVEVVQYVVNMVYGGDLFLQLDNNFICQVCVDVLNVIGQMVEEVIVMLDCVGFLVLVGQLIDSDQLINIIVVQDFLGQVVVGVIIMILFSNGFGVLVFDVIG